MIYFLGLSSSEGFDRKDLSLPQQDLELIDELANITSNLIVVVTNPGAVLLPFAKKVKGKTTYFFDVF